MSSQRLWQEVLKVIGSEAAHPSGAQLQFERQRRLHLQALVEILIEPGLKRNDVHAP
jgi:hypothetical protein